jgi:hypothetical protein
VRRAGALAALGQIELVQLDGRRAGFDRERDRADLAIAEEPVIVLGEAEGVSGFGKLMRPGGGGELAEKGFEILGTIEMAEGRDEALAIERVDRGVVGGVGVALVDHGFTLVMPANAGTHLGKTPRDDAAVE